jgi:hypothetical protein
LCSSVQYRSRKVQSQSNKPTKQALLL